MNAHTQNNIKNHSETYKQLEQMLKDYFDGLHTGDTEKLRALFHDDVVLKTSGKRRPRNEWLQDVATRPVPEVASLPYRFKVLNIEIEQDLAMAKVECPLFDYFYIDYLLFLKEDGQWRIVSKVYTDVNQ